jgi:hypothetical protein
MADLPDIATRNFAALLCIGDVATTDGAAALPLMLLYGRPMIHHQIKALESLGVKRFYIGVDGLPGALLNYKDTVVSEGLDVRLIRDPSAMAAELDDGTLTVVLRADTIITPDLVEKAMGDGTPLVATVEEHGENQDFERIDLNHRWTGLAILERSTLAKLSALPEGWDMASSLLRQTIQDGGKLWPVRQSDVQAGKLHKLKVANDVSALHSTFRASPIKTPRSLESILFAPIAQRVSAHVWSVSWGRAAVEWLFPGLSLLSVGLAISNLPVVGVLVAVLAILAGVVRGQVRAVEYRKSNYDWIGKLGLAALSTALLFIIKISSPGPIEAAYLTVLATGFSLFASLHRSSQRFWVMSPLMTALALLAGFAIDSASLAIQLLILVQLGFLLWDQLASATRQPVDAK